MKYRIKALIAWLLCLITLTALSAVQAVEPLDTDAKASLQVTYQKDGYAFSELDISIYRVAQAFSDGSFELIAPFDTYPVHIHGITSQEQWRHVAATLASYITAQQVAPDHTVATDESGIASFTDLTTGLYLVCETVGENEAGTWVFQSFMVYLPTPQEDGSFDYEIEANPKCASFVPKTQYRVTKLWQDAGSTESRPAEIIIDIFKDGKHVEAVTLSGENDWTYSWYVSESDTSIWTVTERLSEEESRYTVTIRQSGSHFTVINTPIVPPDHPVTPDSPQTGDATTRLFLIFLCGLSGMVLLLLGAGNRRRRDA